MRGFWISCLPQLLFTLLALFGLHWGVLVSYLAGASLAMVLDAVFISAWLACKDS